MNFIGNKLIKNPSCVSKMAMQTLLLLWPRGESVRELISQELMTILHHRKKILKFSFH